MVWTWKSQKSIGPTLIKLAIDDKFQQMWNLTTCDYSILHPTSNRHIIFKFSSRKSGVLLTRLRLGKVNFNQNLYKMGKQANGLCGKCGKPEMIRHFLSECKTPLTVK